MSDKLPAFQFYPGDWRKDPGVQALGFFDRGVWLEILCLMHESDERGVLLLNGSPMPQEALARLLGLDNQNLTTTLTTLLTYGVASRRETDGALVSRRMVRDENLRQIRRTAGSKGGNPVLVNQNLTTPVNQIPTPSSSSSSSINTNTPLPPKGGEPGHENPKPPKRPKRPKSDFDPLAIEIPDALGTPAFRESWASWVDHRREISNLLTPTATKQQLAKLAEWGLERSIAAIHHSIANGWKGIFEPGTATNGESHIIPNGIAANHKPRGRCLTSEELKKVTLADIAGTGAVR